MNNIEIQERLGRMTVPELIEAITRLTETYIEQLAMLTHEILTRSIEQAE